MPLTTFRYCILHSLSLQKEAEAHAESERTRPVEFKAPESKGKAFKFSKPLPPFFDRQQAMMERRTMTFDDRLEELKALQG